MPTLTQRIEIRQPLEDHALDVTSKKLGGGVHDEIHSQSEGSDAGWRHEGSVRAGTDTEPQHTVTVVCPSDGCAYESTASIAPCL